MKDKYFTPQERKIMADQIRFLRQARRLIILAGALTCAPMTAKAIVIKERCHEEAMLIKDSKGYHLSDKTETVCESSLKDWSE